MNVPATLRDRGIHLFRTTVWIGVLLSLLLLTAPADAAVCTSGTSGNWSAITWDCGTPANGDDIVIGTNVTLDLASFTANMLTVNSGVTFDIAGNTFTITNDLSGTGTVNFTTGRLFIGGDGGSCGECMEVALTGSPDVTYNGLVAQVMNKSSYSALTLGSGSAHDYFKFYFSPMVGIGKAALLQDGAKLDLYEDSGISEPVTLDGGGAASFEMQGTSELVLGGNSTAVAPFPTNFGSYTISPDSNVTYDALANQMISSAPGYGNLRLVLPSFSYYFLTHTPDGNLNLQGELTVRDLNFSSASLTLDMLTHNVTAGGGLLVEGQGAVFDGGDGTNTHTFGGDIKLASGGTIINPGTVVLNGAGAQNIIGVINFTNLTLQNAATIDATSNVQVYGALELGTNVLTVAGATPLVLGASSSVNATTGYISGLVERQFDGSSIGVPMQIPVGAGGISAPVSIVVDSLTSTSGSFVVEGFATQPPSAPPGAASFYWQLTPTNIGQADVTFTYDPATLPLPEADYRPARWNGTSWEVPPGATIDPTTNTASVSNQTAFSPWALIPAATCTVISSADSGTGTLREAINNLNAGSCGPTITFDISSFEGTGPHTISLSSQLPTIAVPGATIDGFTEIGSVANSATIDQPVNASWQIFIDGPLCSLAPCGLSGISVSGGNAIVKGLAIQNTGIGISLQGTGALVSGNRLSGHVDAGVNISGSSNQLGGADADRNVIFAGLNYGVRVITTSAANNVIDGNHIGFDQSGANAGTGSYGIVIDNAGTGNAIGTFGRGNVIGNSNGPGVVVFGDGAGASDNGFIEANRIGTNLQGTAASPNTDGFFGSGVYLDTVTAYTIRGNLLSGHQGAKLDSGIYLYQSSGNTIGDNQIGTDIAGTGSIPNNYGIVIDLGSLNNVIGESFAPNTIENNAFDGIALYGGTGNLILENTIQNNGTDPLNDLPIDLLDDGPTANDGGDGDTGPNGLQNFPVLANPVYDSQANTLTVDFTLDSLDAGPGSILVDFYRSDAGFGHMVEHLGSTCFQGSSGTVTGLSMPSGGVGTGSYVTATANSYSDTSCNSPLDGASETAPASVVNTAPVATADAYSTNEDTALSVAAPGVLGNDTDADSDPLTAVLDTTVSNGTLTLNGDGSFTYTPSANFNGTDSFSYHASDGTASSNIVTVTLNVSAVNDAPVAVADSYTGTEDTTLTIAAPGVLGNDTDTEGDPLTAVLDTTVTNGTLTLNADGSFSYTPAAEFNGTESFSYHANDGVADSNIVTVTLNITAVNDAPVAVGDSYAGTEDTVLSVGAPGVLGNDTDADGDPLTAVLDTTVSNGTLTLNGDGSFTYTPSADFNGTDSFSYHASDGTASSNIVTVTLNVTAANDAPVAVADSYTGTEDTTLTIAAPGVLGNDSDVDGDPLTAVLDATVSNGTLTLNADGSFSYTPAAGFNGTDSFSYHANDGVAGSNVVTVTLNITAVNDAPVAVGDSYAGTEDTVLSVLAPGVLGNDNDPESDPLTAV
ncbi:MAG: tandem-95 repeat protein, partial [Acidobacteria bacterium]|nr:tandem-95 repeat protein [Acidobacteriota bacterium]